MIMAIASTQLASVRYLVDDVDRTVDCYTTYLGFTLGHSAAPAFAEDGRGPLRLLSGPTSAGARPIPDGSTLVAGTASTCSSTTSPSRWRGCAPRLSFRKNIISGPVGQQILLHDPARNLIELFQPANR
jgi:catechol 2,3-dioxygenase-like lactoylglutathione lyase family enzyme